MDSRHPKSPYHEYGSFRYVKLKSLVDRQKKHRELKVRWKVVDSNILSECLRDIGLEEEIMRVGNAEGAMQHTRWCYSMAGEEFSRVYSWGSDPRRKVSHPPSLRSGHNIGPMGNRHTDILYPRVITSLLARVYPLICLRLCLSQFLRSMQRRMGSIPVSIRLLWNSQKMVKAVLFRHCTMIFFRRII